MSWYSVGVSKGYAVPVDPKQEPVHGLCSYLVQDCPLNRILFEVIVDRIPKHSRGEEGGTTGSCLCFLQMIVVLLASSGQGLERDLGRIAAGT